MDEEQCVCVLLDSLVGLLAISNVFDRLHGIINRLGLHWVALGCIGLRWVALGCIELRWVALGCIGLRWVALRATTEVPGGFV
jgi:hypothetical protein